MTAPDGAAPRRVVVLDVAPDPDTITLTDLQQLNRQQLVELKVLVDSQADSIRTQLEAARARQHTTGEYADATWWAKANAAMRFKSRLSQAIQMRIRAIRIEAQGDRPRLGQNSCFVEAARKLLSPETFSLVNDEARRLYAMGGWDSVPSVQGGGL